MYAHIDNNTAAPLKTSYNQPPSMPPFPPLLRTLAQVCSEEQREQLLSRVRAQLSSLKKYTYGKHIVARVEKLLSTGTRMQGAGGGSTGCTAKAAGADMSGGTGEAACGTQEGGLGYAAVAGGGEDAAAAPDLELDDSRGHGVRTATSEADAVSTHGI